MQFLKSLLLLLTITLCIPLLSCTGPHPVDLPPEPYTPPTPSSSIAPTRSPVPTTQVAEAIPTDLPIILGKRIQNKLTGVAGGTLTGKWGNEKSLIEVSSLVLQSVKEP